MTQMAKKLLNDACVDTLFDADFNTKYRSPMRKDCFVNPRREPDRNDHEIKE